MAREYAKLKTAIWGDDDYRALPVDAQWLYQYLFSSPKIDICGVTDWDVRKIAAKSSDLTMQRVQVAGAILHQRGFIVVDDDTEEVLVRTFIKHDGSLRGPKTAKGVANAWADVSSDLIRTVIAHETVKIREANPDWSGVAEVTPKMIAKAAAYQPDTLSDPYAEGMTEASADVAAIPTTYPSDTPSETDPILPMANGYQPPLDGQLARRTKRGTRLSPDFTVTDDMRAWARINTPSVDVEFETEKFRDHWAAATGQVATKADWVATWRNWLRRSIPTPTQQKAVTQRKGSAANQLTDDQWQAAFDRAQARDQEIA